MIKPLKNFALALGVSWAGSSNAQSEFDAFNDYPTTARADYVFACMNANGQTRAVLEKCSCSIDTIAMLLPYENYVEAETVLSLSLVGGERMAIFKTSSETREMVAELRRAQAEAEIICF